MSPRRDITRRAVFALLLLGLLGLGQAAPSFAAEKCRGGFASKEVVGRPGPSVSWRAALFSRTPIHARIPVRGRPARVKMSRTAVGPGHAPWLLVLRGKKDRKGRCWVRLRLPWRPNAAAAWVRARRVHLRPTRWRLAISLATRKVVLYRAGKRALRTSVVIGAPATPTPNGLFSITDVWRWNPYDFLGSYILPLTAHSHVLQEFGGGDGRVGIHGRGGESLLAPLGSLASHGCIRLPNRAIESIVRLVGSDGLPGIPVRIG
jgi:lipoprotein-anchoring transpeptidase ErfK/SrfK